MLLTSGAGLGPYEILAAIGAGGMGEVYRARDTRLDRTVAIKVLPVHLAADAQFRERFDREAHAIAALNHPHICTLYDVGEAPSPQPSALSPVTVRFLVMEYLEGETLDARLKARATGAAVARGLSRADGAGLPVAEALSIAIEIADALDGAHRAGIVHRDLKPGNVMLTKAGVKLLDFGLAKTSAPVVAGAGLSMLPTTPPNLTAQGTILGTFQYMAPEQLEGQDADARTDIFAFGAVVYEMATGKKAFEGKSQASLIAAILERDPPPISTLQPLTPPALDRVIRKCLAKDPDGRWQSASDLVDELKWIAETGSQASAQASVVAPRKTGERLAWSVAVVSLVACAAALALGTGGYIQRGSVDTGPVRFQILLPETWRLTLSAGVGRGVSAPVAVSPDGQRIAFVASNAAGTSLLWVRTLDALVARALTGTDDASSPFWSPDGRFLGFFAGGRLKKIEVSGGPPTTLCDAVNHRGGTWSREGVIVFGQGIGPLQKVPAAGGVPTAASTLGQDETGHWRPTFLPDGRHLLYRASPAGPRVPIYLASLDSSERRLLLIADAVNVVYSQNHMLFLRDTTLMAQPFEVRRLALTGEPFPIAEQIQTQGGPVAGVFSASPNGVLAYQTGTAAAGSQLIWYDRDGKPIGALGDEATQESVQLSPDGRHAAVSLLSPGQGYTDVWLYDVARGVRTRFTFDPAEDSYPTWSPDGSRLVFNSSRKGRLDLYQRASTGAGAEELLLADGVNKYPTSWSPDGRFILYVAGAGGGAAPAGPGINDLWVLPLSGDRKAFPFLQTPFGEASGQFSPDGRWIAYQSDESGRAEVYVAPFPGQGGKWMISKEGGSRPRWRHDGKEIFYLDPENKLMAAAVATTEGGGFEVRDVKALFEMRRTGSGYPYDVSADGQRFLVNTAALKETTTPITVVVNWTAGLKK